MEWKRPAMIQQCLHLHFILHNTSEISGKRSGGKIEHEKACRFCLLERERQKREKRDREKLRVQYKHSLWEKIQWK